MHNWSGHDEVHVVSCYANLPGQPISMRHVPTDSAGDYCAIPNDGVRPPDSSEAAHDEESAVGSESVSYTHLTLPTNREV